MTDLVAASLATEAYSIVRTRILRGDLTLGQALSRRKLAAELGMSFLPVTEALLRLEFEGFLESRPRAGTRVRIPSPEDVTGHYVVREALEVQAALLFAQHATPAERSELRRLAMRVDALSLQPDRTVYQSLHQKLHYRIAECARCDALRVAIEKTQALASIWFCVMRRPAPDDSPTRHQDLVDALLSGEPARAAAAVREHLAVGRHRLLKVLEPYFQLRTKGARFQRTARKAKAPAAATRARARRVSRR
jgi:DNA-binding GntR family transcriptional regulator